MAGNRNNQPNVLMAGLFTGSVVVAFATLTLWLASIVLPVALFISFEAIYLFIFGGLWGLLALSVALFIEWRGLGFWWSAKLLFITTLIFCISVIIFRILGS